MTVTVAHAGSTACNGDYTATATKNHRGILDFDIIFDPWLKNTPPLSPT